MSDTDSCISMSESLPDLSGYAKKGASTCGISTIPEDIVQNDTSFGGIQSFPNETNK